MLTQTTRYYSTGGFEAKRDPLEPKLNTLFESLRGMAFPQSPLLAFSNIRRRCQERCKG